MTPFTRVEQRRVAEWFDDVYRRKGCGYLRPPEAYVVFLELLGVRDGDALLDVACGPGVLLRVARGYTTRLHGIDISSVAVVQARRSVPDADLVVGNSQQLPYAANSFDRITCLGSIERMLDASRALGEMHRVGKPGARYCFLVRNSATLSWRYYGLFIGTQRTLGHAGADTLQNWRALFESHGFRVLRVLPDQYPLHRRQRWSWLFLRDVDFKRPIPGSAPLDRANEFVFLLEKSP